MVTPTVDDLKATIQMNLIENNKVKTYDVYLDTKAYGTDVLEIKGKPTRSRLTLVVSNIVEITNNYCRYNNT